jgi:hypothetical protein
MPIDESTGSASNSQGGNFQEIEDKAREAGTRVIDAAKDRARSLFEEQQLRAADQVGSVARALHQAASQLNDENASSYVSRAADQVDRFADTLRSHDLDDLIDQTERFARRQPELFIGGALLLGLAFGRFLKASGDRRRDEESADGRYDAYPLDGEMPASTARRSHGRGSTAGKKRSRAASSTEWPENPSDR